MQTVLFHSTIYGPIHSRRLGMSLGINLMPNDGKICSFDCLYCEAGFNAQGPGKDGIPSREAVKKQLRRMLSNSTMAGKAEVADALLKVDNNILKLDSAIPHTFIAINRPTSPNCIPEGVIADLKKFNGRCIVQTIMLRGEYEGKHFDNTTDEELDALLSAYKQIQPREVMLYSIDRKTPAEDLEKVSKEELERIAQRFRDAGIKVQVNA